MVIQKVFNTNLVQLIINLYYYIYLIIIIFKFTNH